MGVEYAAVVVVGLPRGEFENDELLEKLTDEDRLEVIPPYYDGDDAAYAIVGHVYERSPDYSPSELGWDEKKVDKLKESFKELTGQEAKVYLSPLGW